jgi:hypothetical protein
MAKCFQMTISGDEKHLSGQSWMFNAGPALSLYRQSSVAPSTAQPAPNRFGYSSGLRWRSWTAGLSPRRMSSARSLIAAH